MDTAGLEVSSPPAGPVGPDLRSEVVGTLLLFFFIIVITAGVALCANLVVNAVG